MTSGELMGVVPGRSVRGRLLDADWPITALFLVAVIGGWQLAAATGHLPSHILAPDQIVDGLVANFSDIREALQRSVVLALAGWAIGSAIGVLVGLLAGVSRVVEDVWDPFVGLTYPIPKVAFFPVLAIVLGFSASARTIIVSLSVFYPVYIASHAGAKGIDKELIWVARNAGVDRFRAFFSVVLPATLPRMLVGIRVALIISFLVAFAVELLTAGGTGIANLIVLASQGNVYDLMWGAIFGFAIVAFACDRILVFLSERVTRGQNLAFHGG